MKYSFTRVLVLKPQVNLLTFIHSQLPDLDWKVVANTNSESTAYHIGDPEDDDELWSALENNYAKIFEQELIKLIGIESSRKLQLSLIDFLSCFKFEWHNDVRVVATGIFKTIKYATIVQDDIDLTIAENTTVCLQDICEALEKLNFKHELILPVTDMVKLSVTQKLLLGYQQLIDWMSEGIAAVYEKYLQVNLRKVLKDDSKLKPRAC